MTPGPENPMLGEVYFEFRQIGQSIKVVAVDAQTGVEVTIIGPASSPQSQLQRLALRKLKRRLEGEVPDA